LPHPFTQTPGKVIAVHSNYRSRVAERGRVPKHPSYFLKPSTSLGGSGDPIVRPQGCELLAFEGEVTLVIGKEARNVSVEDAWSHVSAVTAGNDVGVYDMRYADLGSNLRSKGGDGYTPVGPELIDANGLDPSTLRLRTWVNGAVAQDASLADELIFGFDLLVADLSRFLTLEPGDLILTGTPVGVGVFREPKVALQPGDEVEIEIEGIGILHNRVV